MTRTVLAGIAASLVVGLLGPPAATLAQSTTQGTIDIDDCNVKSSRNAGGFTWAYCPIVVQAPAGRLVSVRYHVNLATYKPVGGASYRSGSGTLTFSGGGDQLLNVKFAFRGRSVEQVVQKLKVTLSNPIGATLVDATASANPATGTS